MDKYPEHWLKLIGLDTKSLFEPVSPNLAKISKDADRIFLIKDLLPWLLQLELQAGRDDGLPMRILIYSVLAVDREKIPVHSVVILLRPEADFPGLTGRIQYQANPNNPNSRLEFHYQIVRLWELPVETFLNGGLGTVPLAPLSSVSWEDMPALMKQMDERITRDATTPEARELWTNIYILMGLRYTPDFVSLIAKGVQLMKESSTYQAIIAEGEAKGEAKGEARGEARGIAKGEAKGKAEEARRMLIRIGTLRMGAPSERTRELIERISSVERLEDLTEYAVTSSTWDELLTRA